MTTGRKKTLAPIEADEEKGAIDQGYQEQDSDPLERLEQIAAMLGAEGAEDIEATVNLVDGKKSGFLFGFNIGDYTPRGLREYLRDEYGAGDFSIEVRQGGKYLMKRTITIAGARNRATSVPRETNASPDMATMMRDLVQENARQMREMMLQMQVQQQSQMVEVLKTVAGQPRESLDVIGLLGVAKELFQRPEQPDQIKALLQGIELARELDTGKKNDEDSSLGAIVKTLGAPLVELARSAQAQSIVPRETQAPRAPEIGENSEQQQPAGDIYDMQFLVNQTIKRIAREYCAKAGAGMSPAEAAQEFVESGWAQNLPDDVLTEREKFAELFVIVPEAVPLQDWFEAVRLEVVKLVFDESDEIVNSEVAAP